MNIEKERRAIEYLKAFEPDGEPYYLCYQGGKDSDVIRILANLAGVKHEIHHNLTTVDTPETVQYVKSIPNIIVDKPKLTMWELIVKRFAPPTQFSRYCCAELKEGHGKGRLKITGVRWSESRNRASNSGLVNVIGKPKTMQKKADEEDLDYHVNNYNGLILNTDNDKSRRFVEHCFRTTSTMVNPIIDWTDDDVWSFLNHYGCEANPAYKCNGKRVGCIGCPMGGPKQMKAQFMQYPTYYRAYIRAFDKMLIARKERGMKTPPEWENGEAVMKWWLRDLKLNKD